MFSQNRTSGCDITVAHDAAPASSVGSCPPTAHAYDYGLGFTPRLVW
jgi:hypothetical protein